MLGEFIQDRWIVDVLREIADEKDISFHVWSDDWIMQLGDGRNSCRVFGYRFELNNSVAASIAQDKVATYTILNQQGISAVPHELVRTKVSQINRDVMEKWAKTVTKPLTGTSGHGIRLHDTAVSAIEFIEQSSIQAWAISPYIDILVETRLILLDGSVLCAYEKEPVVINGLKMSNLGLGAKAVNVGPSSRLVDIAKSAQSAIGLRFCSVDVVTQSNGEVAVLEVNDAVMMEHYSRQSEQNRAKTKDVYEAAVDAVIS